jgi:hypothetical protein
MTKIKLDSLSDLINKYGLLSGDWIYDSYEDEAFDRDSYLEPKDIIDKFYEYKISDNYDLD